ncbi:hypothetical protein HK101_002563 [Irineochytrium annulatum]|nr:hypothetical protein HK101_002563 [Irineochytrium annulatum]
MNPDETPVGDPAGPPPGTGTAQGAVSIPPNERSTLPPMTSHPSTQSLLPDQPGAAASLPPLPSSGSVSTALAPGVLGSVVSVAQDEEVLKSIQRLQTQQQQAKGRANSAMVDFAASLEGADAEDPEDGEISFYVGGLFSIETSPAFKALDFMKSKKDEAKIKELKDKIVDLHKAMIACSEYEKTVQKRVKHITQEVSNQAMELDRTANRQYASNMEIGELKRELLKTENEASLAQEREQRLIKEIDETSKLKNDLMNDIEEIRRHKADMLEPQLIQSTKEIKIDIAQRKHQVENLEKDLEEKESSYDTVLREKERLDIEREKHAAQLAKATEMPQKILKQSEVLRDAISSLVIENVKQTTLAQQLDREIERLAHRKKEMEEHKLDQAADYEQRRSEIGEMERQCDDIFKQHEFAREQLSVQRSERVRLDLAMRAAGQAIKREHDVLLRAIRDKEIQLKQHRRLETTVNNVHTSTPTIRKQSDEYARQLETQVREDRYQRRQMASLRREIDLELYDFLKKETEGKEEEEKMLAQQELNRRMEVELDAVVARTAETQRQKDVLNAERDLKSRELIRIQYKYKAVRDDISVKDIAIFDAAKRCTESLSRLRDFAVLYDVVKNERNKYLNQIQATTQRAAEMKEKIKILSNEIEILRHEIMNKDRELTRKRQDNTSAYALRDAAKNEANKLMATYRDRRDQIDQHLSRIETLNTLINAAEEDMVLLKHRYESAVKERNAVGIHLLDRNDELCILYERLNVQQGVQRRGEVELLDREEEVRKLRILASELRRQVELGKRCGPEAEKGRRETEELKRELDSVRAEVARLSGLMESPEDPERCRNLGGEDPNQKDLLEKIKKLEMSLAEKEEKLLEKDLILEEVTTLAERLKRQATEGRTESHEVSTKLNGLNKKIKSVTRAMMARVSELSMYQALAMNLYQEKCDRDAVLENAKERLERGEPPTDEIDKEFQRLEKLRVRRDKEILAARERMEKENAPNYIELEDEFYTYNSIRTMAEPRPNAYIPDSSGIGELPIPKPYGAHAPFKPQDHGSQMRHFRAPKVKPIEI